MTDDVRGGRAAGRLGRFLSWAVVALAVGVSACANDGAKTGGGPASPHVTLPAGASQAFEVIDFKTYDAYHATVWRYQKRCAAREGFQVNDSVTFDSGSVLLLDARQLGSVTEDDARRVGLRTGGTVQSADAPPPPKMSDAQAETLDRCLQQARAKIGNAEQTENTILGFINDLTHVFYQRFNPIQEKLLVAQRRCVVATGHRPVDAALIDNPGVSPARLFGVPTGTVRSENGKDVYTPTPQEIDIAIAMARCSADLRIPQTLMAQAKPIEAEIVDTNDQRIAGINEQIRHLAARATAVLA